MFEITFSPSFELLSGLRLDKVIGQHSTGNKASAMRKQAAKNSRNLHPKVMARRARCWPSVPASIPAPSCIRLPH